jgi:hypothetical protein
MRQLPSTEPKFDGPDAAVCHDTVPATALAQCALHLTRAAIARWSGNPHPAGAPMRDVPRISPQARWLSQAQAGLDTWIADGGFAQADLPELAPRCAPMLLQCAPSSILAQRDANACID